LPFVILLLAGAGGVMASVNAQSNGRGSAGDQPSPEAIPVTVAATNTTVPTAASQLGIAAATSIATSLVAAGAISSAGQSTQPTTTPSGSPTLATTRTTLTDAISATPTPSLAPTATSARSPAATAPPPAPLVTPSAALPYDVSPNGPIVAAYTTYATYSVRAGDTLNRVAAEFGVPGESIMRASGLADPNLLVPGQVLTIPRESGWLYRVQPDETLDTIALRFGINVADLIATGTLPSANVRPGDLLFIPNSALPETKE
jgi:LysM repeat protein